MVLPIAAVLMGMAIKNRSDEVSRANANDDEDRAYVRGQRERTTRLQGDEDQQVASMKQASRTVEAPTPNMVAPETMDNRDVGLPGEQAPTQQGFRVAGQVVPDQQAATSMAAAMNTPSARIRRQAQVLANNGKPVEAKQYDDMARRIEEEGALHFIDANFKKLPSVDEIKAGKNVEFDLDGLPDYNGAGAHKLPDGARGRAKVLKLPSGQELPDFEVVDKDGKTVPGAGSARQVEAIYGYTRAERDRTSRDEFNHGQVTKHQGEILEETKRHNKKVEDNTAENNANRLEIASMRLAAQKAAGASTTPDTAESTFDQKLARATAHDIVKKESEEAALRNTPMTAAQIAKRTTDITSALFAEHSNVFIQRRVSTALGQAAADPVTYAAEYAKALKIVPGDVLAKMGFKAPAGTGAKPHPVDDWIRNAPPGGAVRPVAGQPAAMGQASSTQQAQGTAFDAAGAQFDAANAAVSAASAALMKYGSRQRAADPAGYNAAAAALEQAKAQRDQAQAALATVTPQMSSAIRYPAP